MVVDVTRCFTGNIHEHIRLANASLLYPSRLTDYVKRDSTGGLASHPLRRFNPRRVGECTGTPTTNRTNLSSLTIRASSISITDFYNTDPELSSVYRYCTHYSQLQYRFVSVRKDEMIHLDGIDRFRSFIRISRIELADRSLFEFTRNKLNAFLCTKEKKGASRKEGYTKDPRAKFRTAFVSAKSPRTSAILRD